MTWVAAERVQKNDSGAYRAFINGQWVAADKAQKNTTGEYRVELPGERKPEVVDTTTEGLQQEVPIEELIAGSAPGRAILGAGRLLSGPFQLGANVGDLLAEKMGMDPIVGKWTNEKIAQLEEMKRRGMEAQPLDIPVGPGGGTMTVGGEGMDLIGGAAELATGTAAVAKIPLAATTMARVGQGAKIGAGFGAAAPVDEVEDFATQKGTQIAAGATIGAAIPSGVEGGKKLFTLGRNVVDPFLPKMTPQGLSGIERVAKRTLDDLAGPDKKAIIKILREDKQLPSGQAGVGEVAAPVGRAEFSALQQYAKAAEPTAFNKMATTENQARVAALRKIGGTPEELAKREAARAAGAKTDYGAAFDVSIKGNQELMNMAGNPFFKASLKDAKRLMQAEGSKSLTRYLHFVKLSLDKQLGRSGDTALSSTEKGAVKKIKSQLVDWLAKKNPQYETARANFAEASKPINQMQVGQILESKLTAPLAEGKQRASVFAQALRDAPKTLKQSTGFKGDDLSDVLTPGQLSKTGDVLSSLERQATYEQLSRVGREKTRDVLGSQAPTLPAVGPLEQKYMIFKTILGRVAGQIDRNSMKVLQEIMQNPRKTADLMERISIQDQSIVSQTLLQLERAATIGGAQNIQ